MSERAFVFSWIGFCALVAVIIGLMIASKRDPVIPRTEADELMMPMCGVKRGNDIVAFRCELAIKDGKAYWSKAE